MDEDTIFWHLYDLKSKLKKKKITYFIKKSITGITHIIDACWYYNNLKTKISEIVEIWQNAVLSCLDFGETIIKCDFLKFSFLIFFFINKYNEHGKRIFFVFYDDDDDSLLRLFCVVERVCWSNNARFWLFLTINFFFKHKHFVLSHHDQLLLRSARACSTTNAH